MLSGTALPRRNALDPYVPTRIYDPYGGGSYPMHPGAPTQADLGSGAPQQASTASSELDKAIARYSVPGAPVDWTKYEQAATEAGTGPSGLDIDYAKVGAEAAAYKLFKQAMGDAPVPQIEQHQAEAYPSLTLPQVPERGPVQQDPMASIGAAIAGLLSPQDAGQFGASALHGAMQANQTNYEDRVNRYSQEFQRTEALHHEALQSRNERERTKILNEDREYANTQATTQRAMDLANLTYKEASAKGIGEALKPLMDRETKASAAGVKATLEREKMAQQAEVEKRHEAILQHLLTTRAAHDDRMAGREQTAAHQHEMESIARDRLGMPVALQPGGALVNRQTGESVTSRPPLLRTLSDTAGLYNPASGAVVRNPKPRPSAAQAPLHQELEKARVWRALHDPEIREAGDELKNAQSTAAQAQAQARAKATALAAFEKTNPYKERMKTGPKPEGLRRRWRELNDEKLAAEEEARQAQGLRDTARKRYYSTAKPPPGQTGTAPTTVSSPAEAAKLPKGTRYRTPDGREFVR